MAVKLLSQLSESFAKINSKQVFIQMFLNESCC